jgi:O-antigen/teichoic acid export membrane protein
VFKTFFLYGFGGALTRFGAIFLLPVYTHYMTAESYGALEVALSVQTFLVVALGLQLESALARDLAASSATGSQGDVFLTTVITATVLGVVSSVLSYAFFRIFLMPYFDEALVRLIVISLVPSQIISVILVYFRFSGKPLWHTILVSSEFFTLVTLTYLFVVVRGGGGHAAVEALAASKTVSALLCVVAATHGLRPNKKKFFECFRSRAFSILSYGIPATPGAVVGWTQGSASRLVLAYVSGPFDVALGSLAMRVASIFGFFVYTFRLGWEPSAFKHLESVGCGSPFFRSSFNLYVTIFNPILVLLAGLAPFAIKVVAPENYASSSFTSVLFIFGFFWSGVSVLTFMGLHGARKTGTLSMLLAIGALVNVTLVFLSGSAIGANAMGVGFFIGNLIPALLGAFFGNKLFNPIYSCKLLIAIALMQALLFFFLNVFYFSVMSGEDILNGEPLPEEIRDSIIWMGFHLTMAIGVTLTGLYLVGGRKDPKFWLKKLVDDWKLVSVTFN